MSFSVRLALGPGAMKERIGEWVALRNRCIDVRRTPDGAVLILSVDEPLDAVAGLVARESECCGFYRFSLRVGGTRELKIEAGPGGAEAVKALLSID